MSLVNQSADRIQPDRKPASVEVVQRVTVELRRNQFGDTFIHVDESAGRLHELVGLLELGKVYLIDQHAPPTD